MCPPMPRGGSCSGHPCLIGPTAGRHGSSRSFCCWQRSPRTNRLCPRAARRRCAEAAPPAKGCDCGGPALLRGLHRLRLRCHARRFQDGSADRPVHGLRRGDGPLLRAWAPLGADPAGDLWRRLLAHARGDRFRRGRRGARGTPHRSCPRSPPGDHAGDVRHDRCRFVASPPGSSHRLVPRREVAHGGGIITENHQVVYGGGSSEPGRCWRTPVPRLDPPYAADRRGPRDQEAARGSRRNATVSRAA